MEPETIDDLRTLQDYVGAWSEQNFGVSPLHGGNGSPPDHALIGAGEELGELTRSVLKRTQGIDDDEKYADRDDVGVEAERDAIGDVLIYLMDTLHRSEDDIYVADGLESSIEHTSYEYIETPVGAIRVAYSDYGRLSSKRFTLISDEEMEEYADKYDWATGPPDRLETVENTAGDIANVMRRFCEIRGYDFKQCIDDAWEDVSGRSWDATIEHESATQG